MYDIVLCGNHQEHLTTVSGIGLVDTGLMTSCHAAGNFLSKDGHFRRLSLAVDAAVAQLEIVCPSLQGKSG